MKIFSSLLFVMLSLPAFSQSVNVYPHLMNFGRHAQIQINNTTRDAIYCSGFITLFTRMNQTRSEYFSERIPAGMFRIRHFYLFNPSDMITHAHHSVRCTKSN